MIADQLLRQGKTAEAMEAYRIFFSISEELADRDPANRDRRLALVVSNWKLASLGDNPLGRFAEIVMDLSKLKKENMLSVKELEWLHEAEKTTAELRKSRFVWDRKEEQSFDPALRIHSENPY